MNKIEAVEKTTYNLENDVYEYNWGSNNTCNCGVLARTILNGKYAIDEGAFQYSEEIGVGCGFNGTFNDTVNYCKKTGLPLPSVFKALIKCGFVHKELELLEHCAYDKAGTVEYLKNWLVELRLLEGNQVTIIKEETVDLKVKHVYHVVSVPCSVTEQTKELIMQ